MLVAPPDRGGSVVKFEAAQVHALVGKLLVLLKSARIVPPYGQLTIQGENSHADSIVGASGEFYLENVAAGTYRATLEFAKGTCDFSFIAPDGKTTIVDMGPLTCTMP